MRRNVCMAVLQWAKAHPGQEMSIVEYRILSDEALHFLDLFDRRVSTAVNGRAREGTVTPATINVCGYLTPIDRPSPLRTEEGVEITKYWLHSRLAALLHPPGASPQRRYGPRQTFDGLRTCKVVHHRLQGIRDDPTLHWGWTQDQEHTGALIVGKLLQSLPRISSIYREDAPSVAELLLELDTGNRRFYRTRALPGIESELPE